MKLDYKTIMAVSILISLFSAANYFIFNRLNVWLAFGWGWPFVALGTLLGGASFVFILWHPFPFKMVHNFAACWFGFVFYAFIVFVVAAMVTKIIPLNSSRMAMAALLVALGISVYAVWNNVSGRKVEVVTLRSSKIQNPIRIVVIADTHISKYHGVEYLAGIVAEINKQDPDMVCISGDFADGGTHFSAIEPLNEIKASIHLVMGNHEVWNNHDGEIEKLLNQTKANILHQSKDKGVQLIGVHYNGRQNVLKKRFEDIEIDTKAYNILLYHEPKEVAVAQQAGIDLMLSGHTHGGQIFPWNYVTKLTYKHLKGLYNLNGMFIYVSQGTGVWGPPMRLGSKNEITVIDLKPVDIQ